MFFSPPQTWKVILIVKENSSIFKGLEIQFHSVVVSDYVFRKYCIIQGLMYIWNNILSLFLC